VVDTSQSVKAYQRVDRVLRVHAAREPDLDFHLFGSKIRNARDLDLVLARRGLDASDEAFRGRAVGYLAHHDALVVACVKTGPDAKPCRCRRCIPIRRACRRTENPG